MPFVQGRTNLTETRRRNVDRVDDMSAKDTTAHGRTLVVGLGQMTVDLLFPVNFSRKPIFTYGSDLDDKPAQAVIDGRFPYLNAMVIQWTTVRAVPGAFDGYYVGCQVALVVGGGDNQQRTGFNWAFRETAVRNPVKPGAGLTDTL